MTPSHLLTYFGKSPSIERSDNFPVFVQGEKPVGLWMLEAGELHISRVLGRGRSVVLAVLAPGDLAGLSSALAGEPYETSAQTCNRCSLRLLARADFLEMLHSDAESSVAVAGLLAAELLSAQRWMSNVTLSGSAAAGRLAQFLLHTPPRHLLLTQKELGVRAGLTLEDDVSRLVRDLKTLGAISRRRGSFVIRNRKLLEAMVY